MQKIKKYFSKNVWSNTLINLVGGIGVGLLIYQHLLDWLPLLGGALVIIAIIGYLYAVIAK